MKTEDKYLDLILLEYKDQTNIWIYVAQIQRLDKYLDLMLPKYKEKDKYFDLMLPKFDELEFFATTRL